MDEAAHDPPTGHVSAIDDALALLAPYESLLLAVSGGPDSVALMIACARWPGRRSRTISVATVDHGLRPESRVEAELVGRWAQAVGFAHHVLSWEGAKPTTRLQERARDARYALLANCAKRVGAQAIVTAHHADDQAETILFRLTRGSGITGLAGMAAISSKHGVTLLRPLLRHTKSDLVAICAREAHPFLDDPSNASERFARARLRRLAPMLAAQGLDHDALRRLGARAAQADAALAHYASDALAHALIDESNGLTFDANVLRAAPQEILQRILAMGIARVAQGTTPRLERLERASARLKEALALELPLRLTLADTLIETRSDRLMIHVAPPRKRIVKHRNR